MSQRFGGRYSPNADPQARPVAPAKPHPVGARVNLLFAVPFLFAIGAFFKSPTGLALNLTAFGVLMLAAWLAREGVLAQAAYDARRVARRPAIPRKIFASVLTGLGLGVATLPAGLGAALTLGGIGAVLHFGAFGPDPLADKGIEGVDDFATDRAARALSEAESYLRDMADAIKRSGDRELMRRIDRFSANIRAFFQVIEDDPRRMTAARRYLGVYLMGARDATVKFADMQHPARDASVRADYSALLDDLEERFAQRRDALLADDRTQLDIEIEVLRERLAREGLRANN